MNYINKMTCPKCRDLIEIDDWAVSLIKEKERKRILEVFESILAKELNLKILEEVKK